MPARAAHFATGAVLASSRFRTPDRKRHARPSPRCHRSLLTAIAALSAPARAELVYGITDPQFLTSALVRFDSATPNAMTLIGGITGLTSGQTLRAIDFRPADGQLYAFGSSGTSGQLYTLNLATAVLSAVGGPFTMTGNTSSLVSIDFNPVADRLRVVTGSGQNYRVNPVDGTLASTDTAIASSAIVADVAYSNNVAGATTTTLYGYEYNTDRLYTIGSVGGTPVSPNSGQFFVVGDTGLLSGPRPSDSTSAARPGTATRACSMCPATRSTGSTA